jgi:GT2 family glycosyltransferase
MSDPRFEQAITLSIVSHGQGELIAQLLEDLREMPEVSRIVITRNIPEPAISAPPELQERIVILDNAIPKGFGANHNQAFQHCESPIYCVLNPDIRLTSNPFPALVAVLQQHLLGFVAPRIVDPRGRVEDSARSFPTLPRLVRRRLLRTERDPFEMPTRGLAYPDWIAGMFLLFNSSDYRRLGGFDEAYFLYCEDTDLCSRARRAGITYAICTEVLAVHAARRASHRKLRYLRMHARSMMRFLWRNGLLFAPRAGANSASVVSQAEKRGNEGAEQ